MYSVENKEDERLIWSRFLKGDNQVLSLIYLQHSNALFDYGCRFAVDKHMVKDCIQEVFCSLIRTRSNLGETDNIRLYLLKSLKRKIIRELKNVNSQSSLITEQDFPFDLRWSENMDDQLYDLDEEKKHLLSEAMQSLTERQKEAIYLRFNRGLEYEEISFLLNLNYQSSRALIHRAIEKLREIIQVPNKKINHVLFCILHQ
ncbi:MAG: sigma-70 family RNA polymerase sigma factor [Prolixibacteraceae bacterium]|nr:sigma-70 family RNA polymerase sigma factor [Prolixibacteraceae bacterium]